MTSNERKIIKYLRDKKDKAHVRDVAQKTNFTSDYARLLCRSLARAGYIKFDDSNICRLLKKGHGYFENVAIVAKGFEPVIVTANVTLLTDEPAVVSPASDQSDEEENQEEGVSEDNDKDKPVSSDEELDKALADLEPSSQKDESEEKDKPEEPKDETENESKELEEEKIEKPDETELKPESKAEEEKEKETTPEAEMKTAMDAADGKEEAKAENPEKVALKGEPVKPNGGFGASFKKIVNWFTEKK